MVFKKDKAWIGRWFGNHDDLETESDTDTGYHRLDDSDNDVTVSRRHVIAQQTLQSRDANQGLGRGSEHQSSSFYGYGIYQMSPPPDASDYDLQMRKKEKEHHVNSLWARFLYWLSYTWRMFKTGLLAAGPSVATGPMMAPPAMVSIVSEDARRRLAREGRVPDVYT